MTRRARSSLCRRRVARTARGLTLIELMVSMTVGLLILAAVSAMFVSSSTSRNQIELSADVIENGRYSLDVLGRELSQTGFYGTLAAPTGTTVDMCSVDTTVWSASLAVYAVGLNNADADPVCLVRKADTDAIFIQRASTCAVGEAGCEAETASNAYLQVSECGTEYNGTPFAVAKGNDSTFTLQTKACDGTKAPKRKLIRRIFYVSPQDVLSYVDITPGGTSAPTAVVENIEQMQIEYAVDSTADGTPDSFTATPTAAQWKDVIGVRIWVMARSSTTSSTTKNAATFEMSDTTIQVAAANANYKRRVYSSYIPFVTPKSRLEL